MKLKAIHLFLILIGSLILCAGCVGIREGMSSGDRKHTQYIGPAGDTVDVYTNGTNAAIVGPDNNVITTTSNSQNDDNYDDNYEGDDNTYYSGTTYYGNQGGSVSTYTGPNGNTATVATMPQGIPAYEIPPGDEDLYILKSQIVPPVCPACPTNTYCPRQEPPPPCPPCARCPEPAFDCKKVPNYAANNDQYLPIPILSDFSQFGM